ncbi:MAG: hypothetical protein RL404_1519 [Pseudomonadota bacterium]
MDPEIQTGSTDTGARRRDYQEQSLSSGKAMRIREDLANLKSDLDALMSHASTLSENELHEARDRILARFSTMRFAARGIAEQAGRQITQGRDLTVDYVRDKPLQSVAIAAGVGMLIGAMVRRD